jgi:hypothetical protein
MWSADGRAAKRSHKTKYPGINITNRGLYAVKTKDMSGNHR